jgi:hypothetical protein
MSDKKKIIIEELLESERVYAKSLRELSEYYIEPLQGRIDYNSYDERKSVRKKKSRGCCGMGKKSNLKERLLDEGTSVEIINQDGFDSIFQRVIPLVNAAALFSHELEGVIHSNDVWSSTEIQISQLFLSHEQGFRTYNPYILNYDKTLKAVVHQKETNIHFVKFIDQQAKILRSKNGDHVPHALPNLLDVPIQRIIRYRTWLKELYDIKIWESSQAKRAMGDFDASIDIIEQAYNMIGEISRKTRTVKNNLHSESLQMDLGMDEIISCHRKIMRASSDDVISCRLPQQSTNKHMPKFQCMLFLFDDMLVVSRRFDQIDQHEHPILQTVMLSKKVSAVPYIQNGDEGSINQRTLEKNRCKFSVMMNQLELVRVKCVQPQDALDWISAINSLVK